MSSGDPNIDASIVLNVLGLRELAVYGFRSWMLQDYDRPYEVVLNLFAPCRELFDPLVVGKNPNAIVSVYQYETPPFFNISAANNLGLHKGRGKYIMFANADVIYPGWFLQRAMSELNGRDLAYAVAARCNMTPQQSDTVHHKTPLQYTRADPFNELIGKEREEGVYNMAAISPWMIRRDEAFAVGGFDPKVLFAEDRDLDYRLLHYLRRTGQQQAMVSFCNLYGYHQHHSSTGLINAWTESKLLMESRGRRLEEDLSSTEDMLATKLNDLDALMRDMADTKRPPAGNQYRKDWRGKVRRRAKRVWDAMTGI
jgi:hypothetical protein